MYDNEDEWVHWFVATPGCPLGPSPLERGANLMYRESRESGSLSQPPSPPPPPTPTSRIVIWHHPNCGACRNSEPIFSALEHNTDGFIVERRIATAEVVQSMVRPDGHPHITMLPTYDLIWSETGSQSVYGADLRVMSIQNNNLPLLRQQVPSLTKLLLTPPER